MGLESGIQFGLGAVLQEKQRQRAEALARDRMSMEQRISDAVQARLDEQQREQQRTALQSPMAAFEKDPEVAAATEPVLLRGRSAARDYPTAPEFSDPGFGVLAPDNPDREKLRMGKGDLRQTVQSSLDEASRIAADIFARRARAAEELKLELQRLRNDAPQHMPPASYPYLVDGQGNVFRYNLRNPNEPMTPATTVPSAGAPPKPVMKKKALPANEKTTLQDFKREADALTGLEGSFDDSYAGLGMAGNAIVGGEQMLGSWADSLGGDQERAQWWANLKRMIDIPLRHQWFGSALTPTESTIWERAQTLTPRSDPEVIRKTLREMNAIVRSKMASRSAALVAEGYTDEAVDALTGGNIPQIQGDADYDALPSGAQFRDPEGNVRVKP